VRKYKSERNISLKDRLKKLTVYGTTNMESALEDLENVCGADRVLFVFNEKYGLDIE
jgi:hypothetical protein